MCGKSVAFVQALCVAAQNPDSEDDNQEIQECANTAAAFLAEIAPE